MEDFGDKLEIRDVDGGEEEEFSFICGGTDTPTITAEDAFLDGKVKPMLPYVDFSGSYEKLPIEPPVKKVYVEVEEAPSVNLEAVGPYCELSSRKAVEISKDVCKKSNSTGFSKIRRIKNLIERSNSDGRDAFVFISKKPPKSPSVSTVVTAPAKAEQEKRKPLRKATKTTPLSGHEFYLRSKAMDEEQRRSYLPYRVELMGFFTNIHGGLSKNVHPL